MLPFALVLAGLLAAGLFMNTAWYLHLSKLGASPWWKAVLFAWGIAFFEYLIQVPTNRAGAKSFSTPTLKILAEAASILSFVVVSVVLLKQPVNANFALAAALVLVAAWVAVAQPI